MDFSAPDSTSPGRSKSIPSASECLRSTGPTSDVTATSAPCTGLWPTPGLTTLDCQVRGLYPDKERYHGRTPDVCQLSMFSAADFPVSRTVSPVAVLPPQTTAISGPSSADSFASLNPDGSWRKTCQGYSQATLDGSLETFSETWPRAGMTRSGTAYLRPPLAPLTDATASGSWPTPCAEDAKNVPYQQGKTGQRYPMLLGAVQPERMWPTPSSRDWKDSSGMAQEAFDKHGKFRNRIDQLARSIYATERASSPPSSASGVSGSLNPVFVEWLMGYPIAFTDCGHSATASSRRSRNGSRGGSSQHR